MTDEPKSKGPKPSEPKAEAASRPSDEPKSSRPSESKSAPANPKPASATEPKPAPAAAPKPAPAESKSAPAPESKPAPSKRAFRAEPKPIPAEPKDSPAPEPTPLPAAALPPESVDLFPPENPAPISIPENTNPVSIPEDSSPIVAPANQKMTLALEQFEMARTRTSAALDRTLLAWVRTSLSLICFGFTLSRVVHELIKHGSLADVDEQTPLFLGIGMMLLGMLGLVVGSFEHMRSVNRLRSSSAHFPWSAALWVTLGLIAIGSILMFSLIKELTPLKHAIH